jgi:superfamily I DNA/RNA helicase/CRISPR/Cas system-associated exonuclease Cas4 (RecB family)
VEPFELIRARAAALNHEVVASGTDPSDPLAVALAAASSRDLEVHWLPPKDAALKGARALYDDQSGIICCERDSDPAVRALLVAHELGHSDVSPGPASCGARDIDPAESTENTLAGLRALDYGTRERRELQANVYARELLLPRAFVREQHLDRGLGAASIAARTRLPAALVRQQLFDALLLPAAEVEKTEPVVSLPAAPDPSQARAVAHRGRPFQLQAGPGTGKTRTLVLRTLSLLAEGIDPAAILILTFSNRAAAELSERLTAHAPDAAPKLWIGTFHAFGLDLIRRHHDRLGLPPDPRLFDRSDAIAVLEELLPILPLKHYRNLWDPATVLRDIVAAISRAKDELADPARYRLLAQAMMAGAADEPTLRAAEKCLEIANIYDRYDEALKKHGAVDFGDLIMRPAGLLQDDEIARISVQLRHRHVLVDEYQDVNRASARLLQQVAGDGSRLWVVGDARQSIYRFRGASSENMARFIIDYPGAVVDQLAVNYRSSRQIVDSFVGVASRMGAARGMLPLALLPARGEGPSWPEIRSFDTPEDEAEGVAAGIRQLEQAGVRLKDQGVLCRTNARLNELASALEACGIPVLHLGSLFEREEIRDLLAVLSLVVDPFGDALVRVGAMPRYGLTLQDARCVIQHLRSLRKPALAGLAQAADAPGLSPAGRAAAALLAADLAGLAPSVHAWELLSVFLLDRTDLARRLSQSRSVTGRIQAMAVWQFLNFLRDEGPAGTTGLPIQRTLDRIRQLVLLAEERDLRQVPAAAMHLDAVRLMTVHAAKGLELEAVHVPGLTLGSFPVARQGRRCPHPAGMIEGAGELSPAEVARHAHGHEEECLFFVALSRARTHLRLYHARQRNPSPFLRWLPASLVREIASPPAPQLPAMLSQQQVRVTWPAGWALTDRRLSSYERCPRRFFYTHVLGLGGAARATTAFARTHACIYELVSWLADARRSAEPGLVEAEAAFEKIWKARGPATHAYAAEYRALASRLIAALLAAGAGQRFREAQPLAIDLPNGRVVVEPHEIADAPDGTVIIRRVHTGRKRDDEYDRLEYTLYVLAAQAHFGNRAAVQALHLSDDKLEPVEITPRKLEHRRKKSDTMVRLIAAGEFPPQADAVTCPRCPHFFLCAALPSGSLDLT